MSTNPLDTQIAGSHYKDFPIQPIEFTHKNGMGFIAGCIIKRAVRFKAKTGAGITDVDKIIHEIEILMHFWKQGLTPKRVDTTIDGLTVPVYEFLEKNKIHKAFPLSVASIIFYVSVYDLKDGSGLSDLALALKHAHELRLILAHQQVHELEQTLTTLS